MTIPTSEEDMYVERYVSSALIALNFQDIWNKIQIFGTAHSAIIRKLDNKEKELETRKSPTTSPVSQFLIRFAVLY